jgi:AcrR family transcriptional regulator
VVALLTAAAELVVRDGVRSVTLARIGERAGYSRGIVTHQFGTKKAMLEALARATQAGFVPGLADLPPGLELMLRLIDGYIGAGAVSPEAAGTAVVPGGRRAEHDARGDDRGGRRGGQHRS